jgi:Zn-dependent peptidase ImmA (M78 family)
LISSPNGIKSRLETTFPDWSYRELHPDIHGYTNIEELHCVISASIVENPIQTRFLRSTIAHEIGHFFLHISEFRQRMNLEEFFDNSEIEFEKEIPVYADPEWQAWRFAGALLMPKPALEKAFEKGINSSSELCEIFEVNPAFLNSRLRALKML